MKGKAGCWCEHSSRAEGHLCSTSAGPGEHMDAIFLLCLACSTAITAQEIAVSGCSWSTSYCACFWCEEPYGGMLKGNVAPRGA